MKKFYVLGGVLVFILGMFLGGCGSNATNQASAADQSTMTSESMTGHNMENMTHDGQGGHDMKSMAPEEHSGHSMNNKDNPWPVLYGFGGAILAVIVVAGVMKFAGLKRLEGK